MMHLRRPGSRRSSPGVGPMGDAESGAPNPAIEGAGVEVTVAGHVGARHAGDVAGAYDRLQLELGLVPGRAAHHARCWSSRWPTSSSCSAAPTTRAPGPRQVVARLDDAHARGLAAGGHWVLGRLTLWRGDAEQGCAVLEAAAQARPTLYGPELAVAVGRPGSHRRGRAGGRVPLDRSAPGGPVVAARSDLPGPRCAPMTTLFRQAAARANDEGLPVEAGETLLVLAEHLTARGSRRDDALAVAAGGCATTSTSPACAAGTPGWPGSWRARRPRMVSPLSSRRPSTAVALRGLRRRDEPRGGGGLCSCR